MDAIIWQMVQEGLRHSNPHASERMSSANQGESGRSEVGSATARSSRSIFAPQ